MKHLFKLVTGAVLLFSAPRSFACDMPASLTALKGAATSLSDGICSISGEGWEIISETDKIEFLSSDDRPSITHFQIDANTASDAAFRDLSLLAASVNPRIFMNGVCHGQCATTFIMNAEDVRFDKGSVVVVTNPVYAYEPKLMGPGSQKTTLKDIVLRSSPESHRSVLKKNLSITSPRTASTSHLLLFDAERLRLSRYANCGFGSNLGIILTNDYMEKAILLKDTEYLNNVDNEKLVESILNVAPLTSLAFVHDDKLLWRKQDTTSGTTCSAG